MSEPLGFTDDLNHVNQKLKKMIGMFLSKNQRSATAPQRKLELRVDTETVFRDVVSVFRGYLFLCDHKACIPIQA